MKKVNEKCAHWVLESEKEEEEINIFGKAVRDQLATHEIKWSHILIIDRVFYCSSVAT